MMKDSTDETLILKGVETYRRLAFDHPDSTCEVLAERASRIVVDEAGRPSTQIQTLASSVMHILDDEVKSFPLTS